MANGSAGYDALDGGIEQRFRASGRSSGLFTSWYNMVSQTIRSWHSALTKEELKICEWAFYTMWDLNSRNSAMFDELVLRLLPIDREFYIGEEKIVEKHSCPFTNEEEIRKTIAGLVSRGILDDKSEVWKLGGSNGWREENIRVLSFVYKDLYIELMSSSNENFNRVTDAYFLPRKETRRGPE